jgi:hypothetical protein
MRRMLAGTGALRAQAESSKAGRLKGRKAERQEG